MTERNEEVTFKDKTEKKKAKTKTLKCGKTWNCSLKCPSKSQEKLTKSTSKFLQRKKVNSMAEEKKNLPVFREENSSHRRKYEVTLRILYSTVVGQFA